MPGAPVPTMITPEPVQPAKRSRGPLYAVLAAVALVAVGLGALLAWPGSGGDGDTVVVEGPADPSAFSLAAAVDNTTAASTVHYEMNMAMGGLGVTAVTGAMFIS